MGTWHSRPGRHKHTTKCPPSPSLEVLLTSLWCSAESSEQSVVLHLTCTTPPSCRVHCWCVWTVAHSGVQCSSACMHSSHWSHQHSMTATRRAATRLRLDWTEAGPTLPHSTLVHVQVTECSTATDTHAAGAQDGSQSALTAGPNPTHKHVHVIRTETAVCAHERGSGTRQHDSRHVTLAGRTEGAPPNTIHPSTQPFTIEPLHSAADRTDASSRLVSFPAPISLKWLGTRLAADLTQAQPSVLVRNAIPST